MRFAKRAVLGFLIVLCAGAFSTPARADVSFSFFYSNLSPHGAWHVSGMYGRVWQPYAYAAGWSPYLDGHWAYADVGWTWVSDYPWGAIPYHYGTWVVDPHYGWVWVPGYAWAPSWVVFRTGPGYIGWAPVPPGYTVGISIALAAPRHDRFIFVSDHDFLAPRIRACALPFHRSRVIVNNTTIVNNIRVEKNIIVNRGPDVSLVERASGRKVHALPIERVKHFAPEPRLGRSRLSVDPARVKRGLPVAEPAVAQRGGGRESGRERSVASGRSQERPSLSSPRSTSPRAGGRDAGKAAVSKGREQDRHSLSSPRAATRQSSRSEQGRERIVGRSAGRERPAASVPRAPRATSQRSPKREPSSGAALSKSRQRPATSISRPAPRDESAPRLASSSRRERSPRVDARPQRRDLAASDSRARRQGGSHLGSRAERPSAPRFSSGPQRSSRESVAPSRARAGGAKQKSTSVRAQRQAPAKGKAKQDRSDARR